MRRKLSWRAADRCLEPEPRRALTAEQLDRCITVLTDEAIPTLEPCSDWKRRILAARLRAAADELDSGA